MLWTPLSYNIRLTLEGFLPWHTMQIPSVEENFFGYSSYCIISLQENSYHRGCLHENFLLHCQIKARPRRWRNRQHKEGAACRLLFCNELVEFILRTRDQCSTTQPEGHSTDLCLFSWTVSWISDSIMYNGLLVSVTKLPSFPESSRGMCYLPVLCLLAHPKVVIQWVLDSGVWKCKKQCSLYLFFFFSDLSFIFSCLSLFRQPAEISDAESMKLPMLKLNALTSSLAQNSPNCFVNYFHSIVYFTSSPALGWGDGATWLQNLKL